MALPELIRKSAEKLLTRYCRERVPVCAHDQVRLGFSIRDNHITLFQERTGFSEPGQWIASPVAQFRYDPDLCQWTLHYPDRNRKWHFYLNAGPHLDLARLLRHLDEDPLGIFWG
jgi:hypothetical protein